MHGETVKFANGKENLLTCGGRGPLTSGGSWRKTVLHQVSYLVGSLVTLFLCLFVCQFVKAIQIRPTYIAKWHCH
jgi:hypothetical protein